MNTKRHRQIPCRRESASVSPSLFLMGILSVYIFVQVSNVPFYPVKFDQAQVLYLVRDFHQEGVFPFHGALNSRRAFNPPVFIWLYLLTSTISADPGWVLILPGLALNVVAMMAIYSMAKYHFGSWIGVAAVVIYGFSPLGVYLGQSSWAQGLLPPLYCIWLWFLHRWYHEDGQWSIFMIVFVPFFMMGIHWGGALAVGALFLLCVSRWKKLRPLPVIIGLTAVALSWTPFIYFEMKNNFRDLEAALLSPIDIPSPSLITPLCADESGSKSEASGHTLKEILKRDYPPLYYALRGGAGGLAALASNFQMGPLIQTLSLRGPPISNVIFWGELLAFLAGLWVLLRRRLFALVVAAFFLPALLQNISPHPTVSRPDISWLFYGPQIIIMVFGMRVLVNRLYHKWTLKATVSGALILLVLSQAVPAYKRAEAASGGARSPQREMVEWIAEMALKDGRREISIRYDLLSERPEWCWIVAYSRLYPTYYIGAQHDYLLETFYGVQNRSKTPDGLAQDADFVVLFREGIRRYPDAQNTSTIGGFGPYAVIARTLP